MDPKIAKSYFNPLSENHLPLIRYLSLRTVRRNFCISSIKLANPVDISTDPCNKTPQSSLMHNFSHVTYIFSWGERWGEKKKTTLSSPIYIKTLHSCKLGRRISLKTLHLLPTSTETSFFPLSILVSFSHQSVIQSQSPTVPER